MRSIRLHPRPRPHRRRAGSSGTLPRHGSRHHGRRPVLPIRPHQLRTPQGNTESTRRNPGRAPDPPTPRGRHHKHRAGRRLQEGILLLPGRQIRRRHRRQPRVRHTQQQRVPVARERTPGQHLRVLLGRLLHDQPLRTLRLQVLLLSQLRRGSHRRMVHQSGGGRSHHGRHRGRTRCVGHARPRLLRPHLLTTVPNHSGAGLRQARNRLETLGDHLPGPHQVLRHGDPPLPERRHPRIRLG